MKDFSAEREIINNQLFSQSWYCCLHLTWSQHAYFLNISVFVTAIPPTFRLTACKEEDFMCASGLQCVPDAHRCDRALQCHDGSDEVKCRYVRNKGILFSNYIDISLKN